MKSDAPITGVTACGSTLLDQCADFLGTIQPRAYTAESRTIRGGTLGKHVRHVVDHFAAALAGYRLGEVIDYDHRERQVPMEEDPNVAIATIRRVCSDMGALSEDDLRNPVRIRVMLAGDGSETTLDSTLGREFFFAMHHGIHHLAMMKAIAQEFGVETGADFGKAPSTINYESSRRDC